MRIVLSLLLISTLALTACQSRWNPVNWFGSDEPAPDGTANPLLPGQEDTGMFAKRPVAVYNGIPIQTVKSVTVQKVPEGALITAVGVPYVHGVFAVKLKPRNGGKPENGVLTYDLLGIHPSGAPYGGPERSREVTVGHVVTTQQLKGVHTIRVAGQQNARQARRR